MIRAYIGVGSNLSPEDNVESALRLLAREARLVSVSSFYRAPAEGRPEQPDYVNGVVEIETALPPSDLEAKLLRPIESLLGRRRTADRFAARELDLDLLLVDGGLPNAPAPRLHLEDIETRAYVAIPLAELAQDFPLPGSGTPVRRVAARFDPRTLTRLDALTARLARLARPGPSSAEPP